MSENPLREVRKYGQSIWLDFIRRNMLHSGELARMIEEDGVRGVTSNPSIFEKAIAGSSDYDEAVREMAQAQRSVDEIYERLTVADVRDAADLFRPLYEKTSGGDGYVSLEVSPHLAHDTQATIAEARRLWADLDRPNVLIKVPATREGLPAIQQLISEGINVNVTLLFGLPRYRAVAEAYISGLESRLAQGGSVDRIASVASFFLSRIDVLVDPMLEKRMKGKGRDSEPAAELHGQAAISSAKVAYQTYKEIFGGDRFQALAQKGAHRQRLLWASTSTKDPTYSDVKYVEALIGPETVNTIPMETLNAYRDHGQPAARLETDLEAAQRTLDRLPELGIDLAKVTQQLEDEGVEKFIRPFDRLMETLTQEKESALFPATDAMTFELGEAEGAVDERITRLDKERFTARLWRKDPALWKQDPQQQKGIKGALGWLHVAEKMEENLPSMQQFVEEVKAAGFQHVVHMGMGGSSLAPLVFARTFSAGDSGLPLTVLDTTDPETILKIERSVPLEHALFIVASKSGSTAETLAFGDYFYQKVLELRGTDAGASFVAITDPGTHLERLAKDWFRRPWRAWMYPSSSHVLSKCCTLVHLVLPRGKIPD
jgi:transaldolase/glucose-6-phosphate isomerase